MSRFVLKPARLLQTRFVTSKTEPAIELNQRQLVERFAEGDATEAYKLAVVARGMFIGRTFSARQPQRKVVFLLKNPDFSGNVDFVLKRDPTFETRLIEAFRVEEVEQDRTVTESQGKLEP